METIRLFKPAVVVLVGCWWSQLPKIFQYLGRSKEIGLILPKKANITNTKSPQFDAPFSQLCGVAVVVLCCGSDCVSPDGLLTASHLCLQGVHNHQAVVMVEVGEAGNDCTSTWGRFYCRNGWEVNVLAVVEAGNGCTRTWGRVYCRNGWEVEILPDGWEEGVGDGCTVTLTDRRSW